MTQVSGVNITSNTKVKEVQEKEENKKVSKTETKKPSSANSVEDELVDIDIQETKETNDTSSVSDSSSPKSIGQTMNELNSSIRKEQRELDEKQAELQRLKEKVEKLEKRLENASDDDKSKIQRQLDSLNNDISTLTTEIQGLTERLNQKQETYNKYYQTLQENAYLAGASGGNAVSSNTASVESTNQNVNVMSFDGYNSQRGKELAQAAESLYGNTSRGTNHCARGVSQAMQKAFGKYPGANGNTYDNWLEKQSDWKEVKGLSINDLQNLPAGAIVSWEGYGTGASRQYGHVYISDGKGNEISDYKKANNRNAYRANNGGTYRVFIPV